MAMAGLLILAMAAAGARPEFSEWNPPEGPLAAVQTKAIGLIAWSADPAAVRKEQAAWEAHHGVCTQPDCVAATRVRWNALAAQQTAAVARYRQDPAAVIAHLTPAHIAGEYEAGDRAHEAVYGHMTIGKQRISWKGKTAGRTCSANYVLAPAAPAKPLAIFAAPQVAGREHLEVVLKLSKGNCEAAGYFVFTFLSDVDGVASFSSFGADGHGASSGHFYRLR